MEQNNKLRQLTAEEIVAVNGAGDLWDAAEGALTGAGAGATGVGIAIGIGVTVTGPVGLGIIAAGAIGGAAWEWFMS